MATLWQKLVTLRVFQKQNKLPETPGVYFFLGAKKELLYIGKATSLRDRVKSYFAGDLMEARGPKIALMLGRVRCVAYQTTDSVLEALILETNLIKERQPPYNTDAKDDKSYNHVVITEERFPRVLMVRGRDIEQKKFIDPVRYMFGPFPHGLQLREAMKIVRRLFPYRDKCVPMSSRQATVNSKEPKPCFDRQIGLCPGVCTGEVTAREYGNTIRHIRLFFEGKKTRLEKQLEREMKAAAKRLEFERAGGIKKTLFGLKHIQDMALLKDESAIRNRESWKGRIEAYDVAHLGGGASVGVMTVVESGRIDKDEYRQFRLRGKHGGNDLSALEEILRRRLRHPEWPLPDIVAVDGSKLQLGVAEMVLHDRGFSIPVVGVVKDARHRPERIIGPVALAERFKGEILLANGEAHRFAIGYHRKHREKEFLGV